MSILLILVEEIGLHPKRVASTNGGEYHCACPSCGGKDRFIIQPNYQMRSCIGRYLCRQCKITGDTIQFCRDFLKLNWNSALVKCHSKIFPKQSIYFEEYRGRQITPPPPKWQEKIEAFVNLASREIIKHSNILDLLSCRGLSEEAVHRYRIGYCENPRTKSKDFYFSTAEFGLPEKSKQNSNPQTIWIPSGIVIPTIEPSGAIIRVKIRRLNYYSKSSSPKYAAISGSMQGMNLIGDRRNRVMIVVESELDAYALHDKVGDFAFIVSVGSNNKNPDNFTNYLAKEKQFLLVCHDNDKAGQIMLDKWKNLYPHAKSYPTLRGKDIGEAIRLGEDIRDWILCGLPADFRFDITKKKSSI